MSTISWLLVVAIAAILGTAVIKLVPAYIDDFSVGTVLKNLQEDPKTKDLAGVEIQELISKRLEVNNIDIPEEQIIITDTQDGFKVNIDYEVRKPLIANIDLMANFSHEATM